MKKHSFFFFFNKSVSQRKGRVLIASAAVTLAVAVITGMAGITTGIREKLGAELKAYGANIVVSAQGGGHLTHDSLGIISAIGNVQEVAGQVFGNVAVDGHSFELIGLDLGRIKGKGWRIYGNWPQKKGEILAGVNLKNALKLEAGSTIYLSGQINRKNSGEITQNVFHVSGFIERGGTEDNAFIMSLEDAWAVTGLEGALSAVLVNGRSGELDGIVGAIKKALPSVSVKTMRQVALAEETLLSKIQLLLAFLTVVVLFATGVSVASTMGANVLERREEIGLMKAIGAKRKDINMFYQAEAVLIGLSGGLAGFALGYVSIQAVSHGAFHSFIRMPFYVFFLSMIVGIGISVISSSFPVRDALKYNPSVILRGE